VNYHFSLITLWPIGLYAAAILCAILAQKVPSKRVGLSFLTAFFSVIGLVCALISGMTLQELVIPYLILVSISLWSGSGKKGEQL